MPYIGRNHIAGDHTSNFKVLDDISSYTATFNGSSATIISTADETIRIPEHRFLQGQRVTYSNGGGGNIGGLTNSTAYFVTFDTANTFKLATSLANANNNTNINLSSVGTGSAHTLTAAFDGVNTTFKITHGGGSSANIANSAQLQVAINNVIQKANLDSSYTEGFLVVDSRKIQFKTAPTADDIFWGNIIANTIETFDISDLKIDQFTGDGTTTQFTLSREVPNNQSVMVTLDGVVQHPSDKDTTRAYRILADTVIEFSSPPPNPCDVQVRHLGFAGAATGEVSGFYGRTGNVVLGASDHITTGDITPRNINASGIVTASTFSGGFSGNIVGTSATFTGNLSVGGVLTYEDVTSIDSVGIITAQKDIHVGAGVSAVGIITGQFLMATGGSDANKQNVKIGWMNSENLTTGGYNVLIGRRAGEDVDTASNLVIIGANAGFSLTNQNSSVIIGSSAGNKATGDGNVYIGKNAAQQSTSAASNVIIGTFAGIDNQGNENTLIGYYSGRGNSGVTDGTRNTFIGTKSGFKIQGGDDNTGLGRNSLVELLGGNKNVAIGQQAGDALVSGNNNIIIGYRADASTSTTSNEITLGDANINHLRIPGIGVSFNSTGGTQLGIITATELDISGDIVHIGDTNTKIRFPADDTISFETAGSQHLRVASNGNIGIGTANNNPTSKLHIVVDGVGQGIHIANKENLYPTASTGYSDIRFSFRDYQTGGSSGAPAIIRGQSHSAGATSRSSKLIFLTSSSDGTNTPTEKMRIEHDGRVGIDRTSPSTMLDIKVPPLDTATITTTNCLQLGMLLTSGGTGSNTDGHIYNGLAVGDGYAGLYGKDGGSSAATDLEFFTGSASAVAGRMRIQDDGKIIIGGNVSQSINRNVSIVAPTGNSQDIVIGLQPTNSSGGYNPEAYIGATADGTYGAAMYFYTRDTSGTRAERLRITSAGNVGINESNPADKLVVNGTTDFKSNSYIGGDLYMYGNSYGNGVFLGGSNAVHKLDYYKKGTWTPSMWRNGHGSEIPLGSGNRFGHYVRVGDLLHVSFYWYNPSLSASSGTTWVVRDLPFDLLYSSGSAYQFIPGGYFYQQGDSTGDSGNNGSYRWQANGSFSANTLTLYAANNTRDANGATEFSGTGTLIIA